jgi:hypothetical protein
MRYALVKLSDSSVDRFATNVDPAVQTKPGYKWLPCDPVSQPAFDATAETVDGPTYTVGASSVTEVWTKRNLTAQETSDRKESAISGINGGAYMPVFRALFNLNNRVLALEGKQTLTAAQFRAALKALL